jgi:hypothetical protein
MHAMPAPVHAGVGACDSSGLQQQFNCCSLVQVLTWHSGSSCYSITRVRHSMHDCYGTTSGLRHSCVGALCLGRRQCSQKIKRHWLNPTGLQKPPFCILTLICIGQMHGVGMAASCLAVTVVKSLYLKGRMVCNLLARVVHQSRRSQVEWSCWVPLTLMHARTV